MLICSTCPNSESESLQPLTAALTGPLFFSRTASPHPHWPAGGQPEAVGSAVTSAAQQKAKLDYRPARGSADGEAGRPGEPAVSFEMDSGVLVATLIAEEQSDSRGRAFVILVRTSD